ncbi:putative E3 SUMO-protein ligase PIAS1 [Monocercomonoides exilis]|uniref:putative E3 SUMO-protein ligase PIAS1 n=1 Tax=Monocercomonoides exilis TaxID=2049356 RepID=UPI003559440A|nr:putative E3 SUMO-protein ligase PIAS1 [Monocercomonoides exilis]|eukprot:MONOS_759.1-p1 / transcript=MONOS_759.1 / gene=MONOS_759 / organism=Monocercomonoides_exilis_PA203 / gene_product=E3 SUMO-protein ligase PIAS1 / transcript_product=E3 SUMO-protein ligase PIAS1 / location=Mono_scaffold00012:255146-257059(+) / protein_length=638 / sequence_SO=supercontig / SO=protein_coding / is_pseudo=false
MFYQSSAKQIEKSSEEKKTYSPEFLAQLPKHIVEILTGPRPQIKIDEMCESVAKNPAFLDTLDPFFRIVDRLPAFRCLKMVPQSIYLFDHFEDLLQSRSQPSWQGPPLGSIRLHLRCFSLHAGDIPLSWSSAVRVNGIPVDCTSAAFSQARFVARSTKQQRFTTPASLDITAYVLSPILTIEARPPPSVMDAVIVPMIVTPRTISQLVTELRQKIEPKRRECQLWEEKEQARKIRQKEIRDQIKQISSIQVQDMGEISADLKEKTAQLEAKLEEIEIEMDNDPFPTTVIQEEVAKSSSFQQLRQSSPSSALLPSTTSSQSSSTASSSSSSSQQTSSSGTTTSSAQSASSAVPPAAEEKKDDMDDDVVVTGKAMRRRVQGEVSETVTAITMQCPLSLLRISCPARSEHCNHFQCFDLKSFLQFCRRDREYSCPICHRAAPFTKLVIDLNMERIMREVSETTTKVIVMDDGRYVEEEKQKEGSSDVFAFFERRKRRREAMREQKEREREEREKERRRLKKLKKKEERMNGEMDVENPDSDESEENSDMNKKHLSHPQAHSETQHKQKKQNTTSSLSRPTQSPTPMLSPSPSPQTQNLHLQKPKVQSVRPQPISQSSEKQKEIIIVDDDSENDENGMDAE